MSREKDVEYYARRATECRDQATRADDAQARAIYLDMAARYDRSVLEIKNGLTQEVAE